MNNAWLVFSSSLTARQQALRVKVWRRLSAIGAVPLKNSLWLLPGRDDCREHLTWLAQEVEEGGGEAVLLTCSDLGGFSEADARQLFRQARDADYAELEAEASRLAALLAASPEGEAARRAARAFLRRAERRLASIANIDFFPSGRGETVRLTLDDLAKALDGGGAGADTPRCRVQDFQGRTWVTRARPYIDRLSSFWLVRRRIDAGASIRFLAEGEAVPQGQEFASFDLPGADFTHRGELVSFETIAADFGIRDVAVRRLMGIVKAIDLADALLEDGGEDGGLPAEARAVKDVLDGLLKISTTDAQRLERAMLLFDALAATYTPTTGE
ncbi:MAG: chromate resistance protein ChrB domain-containing protein [Humidesulfovibrio sp.]